MESFQNGIFWWDMYIMFDQKVVTILPEGGVTKRQL